jgi:hypothetical protein
MTQAAAAPKRLLLSASLKTEIPANGATTACPDLARFLDDRPLRPAHAIG